MNLVLYKHHSFIHCFVLSLKDQTYTTDSRKPFLEIDVKGGERDHIKACRRERSYQGREKVSRTKPTREKVLRGRKRFLGGEKILKDPRCLMFKRRDVTCIFGGKTCSLVLFICIFQLWFAIPYLLQISHVRFRGSKTPKGKKSVKFIAYLYSWGHVESNVVPCTHSLHVIPVLVFLWFLLFALASGCTCVI